MVGVSTLIIFVSLILVGAITAAVLLGSVGGLQQKASSTAREAEGIGSGVQIVYIDATNGTDHNVETFRMIVQLRAGSDPINFARSSLTFDTVGSSKSYTYNSSTFSTSTYNVSYIRTNPNVHEEGYIRRGEIAALHWNVTPPVGEEERVKITLYPSGGDITSVEFFSNRVMTTYKVPMY